MLTRDEFQIKLQNGLYLLDGATGSNLRSAGMPKDCCAEQWILEHPEPLVSLQRSYAQSGCQIVYAPTFQAQPIALARVGLDSQTEAINASLVALSRSAAPGCLIAGDLTTLSTFCDSFDPECFDLLVDNALEQVGINGIKTAERFIKYQKFGIGDKRRNKLNLLLIAF